MSDERVWFEELEAILGGSRPEKVPVNPHALFQEEVENLPTEVRKFLTKERRASIYDKTWENLCGAYGDAFNLLSQRLLAERGYERVVVPLFYLCRHSVELSIKHAVIEYAEALGEPPDVAGHSLASLWNELARLTQAAGFPTDDPWTVHCGKLVRHLHDADPDGERFRYPASRSGVPFECTRVDVERLAVAHWHIGVLCDAAGEMLAALGPKNRGAES